MKDPETSYPTAPEGLCLADEVERLRTESLVLVLALEKARDILDAAILRGNRLFGPEGS